MPEAVLTQQILNRTLLHRQLLLDRAPLAIPDALDRVAGLQTQYAPSGYVGLWTRLRDFRRAALTQALEDRSVIQGTLMRGTIHLVSAREYWLFAMGIRRARREWALRTDPGRTATSLERHADELRAALADGPRSVAELGGLAAGFVGNVGLWVDIVRVPPSGTWERRRADVLALAEQWVGPCDVTEDEGREHLVRSYLRGFGPAPLRDISSWAGVPVTPLKAAATRLPLRRWRDASGRELVDLEDGPLPPSDAAAPVRFLAHWDASLLAHARRTGLLSEPYRARMFTVGNPFSVGAVVIDGAVAGAWTVRKGRLHLELYEEVTARTRQALDEEAARLEAFHLDGS